MFRCGGACDFLITYVENSLVGRRNHMCLTLVCCDRCSSNQCEVDIWCHSGHMVCVVVNPPRLKNLLERFWDHFGTILVSVWYQFGIILVSFWNHFGIIMVSFWRYQWDIENRFILELSREVAWDPPLTGNFLVKALKMEMTVWTRDFLVKEVRLSKTCEDIETGSANS